MAKPSGVAHSMSTVAAPQETGQDASGELPEVVQQPAPSESGSETSSAADTTGTSSSETEDDASNGSSRQIRGNRMALAVGVVFVGFVV